uniref:Uncharacterized protein n=1 Tax=Ditylum brightwellii TaxID=49249 RepID=A0A7S4RV88_9STRA
MMTKLLNATLLLLALVIHHQVNAFQTPLSQPKSQTLLNAASDNTRRSFLVKTSTILATTTAFLTTTASPANAKYGDSSNMELPNYIDFLIEKNNYGLIDSSAVLYKGADPLTLLNRLQDANTRLSKDIIPLVDEKKWSQIQGIVTGPLGTLSQTINSISTAEGAGKNVKEEGKKLKGLVIDIGQMASKKDGEGCKKKVLEAQGQLEVFVKVAFP